MTFQEPMTNQNSAGAQGAFTSKSKPKLAVDNTMHDKEEIIAQAISKSQKPIIIITEAHARPNASYKMMRRALPNVPVVFESEAAKTNFIKGRYYDREIMNQTCVGHFERVSDYTSVPDHNLCHDIKTSDCVMVLGTPKADLQKELDRYGDYFINHTNALATTPRINFSVIEDMERKTLEWSAWTKQLMKPRSL